MIGSGSRRRSRTVRGHQDDEEGQNSIRRYLGAFVIATLISIAVFMCFKIVLVCILMLLNIIDAAIQNANRSNHTLVIQRFDNELHVETQIDPKLQISHVFLPPQQQKTCTPRDTIKDFEKGTEVFTEGDNCFVRFCNQSGESYDQQMILLETLKGLPLQQPADPTTYQAVQHLQFTDRVYDLLGRQVAAQCNLRRLFWIFPAAPLLARHLTTCRCFDTLHARISVCLQMASDTVRRPQPWDMPKITNGTRTERQRMPPVMKKPRRGIDSIIRKPDDMELE